MWERYDKAAEAVIAHLEDGGHADTTVTSTRSCLRDLRSYLAGQGIEFSRDAALEWLAAGRAGWSHGKFKGRRLALCRFDDAWVNGSVTRDRYVHDGSPLYERIPAWGKDAVDSMLAEGVMDVAGAKANCARFLLFAESMGADGVDCLGPAVTTPYVVSLASEPSRNTTYWRLGHLRAFLGRIASGGFIPESTVWLVSTILVKRAELCAPLPAGRVRPRGSGGTSAQEAVRLSLKIVREILPRQGYAYGTVKNAENVLLLLFCAFLLVNHLDYDFALAMAWVDANRETTKAKWRDYRRALLLLEHLRAEGRIPDGRVHLAARGDPMGAAPNGRATTSRVTWSCAAGRAARNRRWRTRGGPASASPFTRTPAVSRRTATSLRRSLWASRSTAPSPRPRAGRLRSRGCAASSGGWRSSGWSDMA